MNLWLFCSNFYPPEIGNGSKVKIVWEGQKNFHLVLTKFLTYTAGWYVWGQWLRLFFKIANSQYFFVKLFWIGPWVSRIEWCEGHWSGSTYMAVRLFDICSKTGKIHKKCNFCLFWSICQTASRPYRLSKINALRIIQSY